MINTLERALAEAERLEPFDDRIDILYHELELATKWQCPSLLLAIYSSEYVHGDAEHALENRLLGMGQRARHIVVKSQEDADIPMLISGLTDLSDVVVFVEGLRWGCAESGFTAYQALNKHREFFIENRVRVVFWLTETEAIQLAHHAPDYWTFRHRVIEFVDSPKPEQIQPQVLETAWQGLGGVADSCEDLDDKITLRTALLADLPEGEESTSARANLLLTLGILHWRRGDYDLASQFLSTALDLAGKLQDARFEALIYNAIALVETATGRPQQAIRAYQHATALAPDQVSPWNNLGSLYYKLEQYEDALEAYKKAVEQKPSERINWCGLGDTYYKLGGHEEAIFAFKTALGLTPNDPHCWKTLADVYVEEGQLDEAYAAYQKAIELDRRSAGAWIGLGDIHRLQKEHAKAVMAYQTAIEIDPDNAEPWEGLGDTHLNAGATGEAIQAYQKAIELDKAIGESHSRLASIFIQQGNYAKAIPLLEKGIHFEQDSSQVAALWNQLGDAYRKVGDYDNAMKAYRQADGLDQGNATPTVETTEAYEVSPVEVEKPVETPTAIEAEKPVESPITVIEEKPAESPIAVEESVEEKSAMKLAEATIPELVDATKDAKSPVEASAPALEAVVEAEAEGAVEAEAEPVLELKEENLTLPVDWENDEVARAIENTLLAEEQLMESAETVETTENAVSLEAETSQEEPTEIAKMVDDSASMVDESDMDFARWLESLSTRLPDAVETRIPAEGPGQEAPADEIEPVDNNKTVPSEPEGVAVENVAEPTVRDDSSLLKAIKAVVARLPRRQNVEEAVVDSEAVATAESTPEEAVEEPLPEPVVETVPTAEPAIATLEKEARFEVPAAVGGDLNTARIWNELGNIYYNIVAYDEAIKALKKAIELDHSYGWTYNNLASVYIHKGDYAEAIPWLQQGIPLMRERRDQAMLWNRLGDTYRHMDQQDKAADAYQKAIELSPENVSLLTRARFSLLGNGGHD